MNVLDYLKIEEIVELASDLIRQPSLTNKEGPAVDFMIDWYNDNGFDEVDRVHLFVMVPPDTGSAGDGFWITASDFPMPGTVMTKGEGEVMLWHS